jgi:hypothetical protein
MSSHPLTGLTGIEFLERRHAVGILTTDYPEVCDELFEVLGSLRIPHSQVIEGGGGKSSITHGLEDALKARGWQKKIFKMTQSIDGRVVDSTTHEIDHFKLCTDGRPGVALEIEWNNKDPFYDRDLAAFSRLHMLDLMSVGIIITRGPSLQAALRAVLIGHYSQMDQKQLDAVTIRMSEKDQVRVAKGSTQEERGRILADIKAASKYGESTTHWRKLMDRLARGLGNPCPLLLIGIEQERLQA